MKQELRHGRFTSSGNHVLLKRAKDGKSFGAPAMNYIAQKGMERRLGRSISTESNARELSWGRLVERRVFDLLGLDYTLNSQDTITHPTRPYWAGSPDGFRFIAEKTVFDIKCPFTLKSFCTFVDAGDIFTIRDKHDDGEKYYQQIVSNACISDCDWGELIVYCPYKSELPDIRLLADNCPPDEVDSYRWMNYASDEELPYLIEGNHYRNINIFRFPIPEYDKALLTASVDAAEAILNPSILLASPIEGGIIIESK